MPTKTISNSVQFPAADADRESKLNKLLATMAEFMEVELDVKKVTIIQVTIPEDRPDVLALLVKIGAYKKNGKP